MPAARPDLHTQLATAAKGGNLARVRALLAKGARPDVGPWTALSCAVESLKSEVLVCLIEAGPNQEALDEAMKGAAMLLRPDLTQLLLDAGAKVTFDPNAPEAFKWPRFGGEALKTSQTIRRMLAAHWTAGSIERVMDRCDANDTCVLSSAGPAPL